MSAFAADTLTLDPNHTYVLWQINHFGFSTQAGKWYANGTLTLDKEKPENSKVNATIQVSNMITGLPELDKHLSGKLFFDTAQFPTATFTSSKVEMTGKKTAKVYGTLTLHGVSRPIALDVTLNQVATNPINDKETYGFTAKTIVKRSDFGMNTLLPGLSDTVEININAEAAKA
ncbi:MAG TPA: YceI family protein [Gammaproteobacteria bacterium]|nr:YceI family protein [Gammaproteobacteria bacterium]